MFVGLQFLFKVFNFSMSEIVQSLKNLRRNLQTCLKMGSCNVNLIKKLMKSVLLVQHSIEADMEFASRTQ